MANINGPKYTGAVVFDLTSVKDDLVDLPPGALKGARAPKEGIAEVLNELAHAIPNHGEEAEIHPAVYQRIVSATSKIEALNAKEMELLKGLEVVRETRGKLENNREDDISLCATQVETKADKGGTPGLRAHFEKTIAYKSQHADKAAETRRKNEEAAKAAGKQPPPTPGGGQAPPVQ